MRTIILSFTMIVLSIYQSAQAQQVDTLSIRQQRIVAIAATTARGDLENLKTSLDRGLDDGMTVNEIKRCWYTHTPIADFPAACVPYRLLWKSWTSVRHKELPTP